jgi:hypothetical protein
MLYRFSEIALIAALTAFLNCSPAAARDTAVKQAWSRATPKGTKVAGGYLASENRGIQPDRLLSASSSAAAKVEIHQAVAGNRSGEGRSGRYRRPDMNRMTRVAPIQRVKRIEKSFARSPIAS